MVTSSPAPVKSGVLQGSILGPLLFIVYVNLLASLNLSPGTSIILFADDIILYRSISTTSDNTTLQHDVDLVTLWIESSGLAINPTKSTHLIISRMRVKPHLSLQINSTIIPIAEIKYLGVTISSNLKLNVHILNICNSAKYKLGLLYRNFYWADQTHLFTKL